MSDSQIFNRRLFLTRSLQWGAGLFGSRVMAEVCGFTPAQMEGPYYPEGDLDRDADLVLLEPGAQPAKGQIIHLSGRVLDEACRPLSGALVEIWQACFSGKYNHSEDPNDLELDTNFQYWGRAKTDSRGQYRFRTIIPGHYPTGPKTYRPPHIHFKVHAAKHVSLTTQMYFDPKTYSDEKTAAFVKFWNAKENVPSSLVVHFVPRNLQKALVGEFNVTLRKQ